MKRLCTVTGCERVSLSFGNNAGLTHTSAAIKQTDAWLSFMTTRRLGSTVVEEILVLRSDSLQTESKVGEKMSD